MFICYSEWLVEVGIEFLVGSVGDSYDNVLVEMINGLFKVEVIYCCGLWCSFQVVEYVIFEWVDWFNNCCLFELIGNILFVEVEVNFYVVLEIELMVV